MKQRTSLLVDSKNKVGIYCFVNQVNGHLYVGSSINIKARISSYFSKKYLLADKNKNMPICKAFLKYGHKNFAVFIIEYTDVANINIRETYRIRQLAPYYNILKQAYTSLGFKHSAETKAKLSKLKTGLKLSAETKSLISLACTGDKNPFFGKVQSEISKLKISASKSTSKVYIYNSFCELIIIYPSITYLAKLICSNNSTIKNYTLSLDLFRGNWYITSKPLNSHSTPLIDQLNSKEANELILDIKNHVKIRKVIFLYSIALGQFKFIKKFDGIMIAEKELNIRHEIIKSHANKLVPTPYNGYLFSYHRLQ